LDVMRKKGNEGGKKKKTTNFAVVTAAASFKIEGRFLASQGETETPTGGSDRFRTVTQKNLSKRGENSLFGIRRKISTGGKIRVLRQGQRNTELRQTTRGNYSTEGGNNTRGGRINA